MIEAPPGGALRPRRSIGNNWKQARGQREGRGLDRRAHWPASRTHSAIALGSGILIHFQWGKSWNDFFISVAFRLSVFFIAACKNGSDGFGAPNWARSLEGLSPQATQSMSFADSGIGEKMGFSGTAVIMKFSVHQDLEHLLQPSKYPLSNFWMISNQF